MTEATRIEQLPEASAERADDQQAYERRFVELPIAFSLPVEYAGRESLPPPDRMLLGSLGDGRLRVGVPITVKLSKEGQHIVAEAVEFNEFGFGGNPSEAVRDLQRAIVELYFTLERGQDRLGPDLEQVWASLREKILRRQ